MAGSVGAGIVNIITESLYDKPIVVFREYVQNSVDSFRKESSNCDSLVCNIWIDNDNLYFLDNGNGINKDAFEKKMTTIASSEKQRKSSIGYKGIGRLSGLPYCNKITFVNISSVKEKSYQKYVIDGVKYNEIKKKGTSELLFEELMAIIGSYNSNVDGEDLSYIESIISSHMDMYENHDNGFLVILQDFNFVLKQTIEKDDFIKQLGWLLPVNFNKELFNTKESLLFSDLVNPYANSSIIPAKGYNILYNHILIERPLRSKMLRSFTCRTNFSNYAVGFHSFSNEKIQIDNGNDFSGIRLYIDNILLCDETEIIPVLLQYGLISHSSSELIQTVRGLGAIIYIIDKVNITANARRTFIEITDNDALSFLQLLGEFIDTIYETRYALSRYNTEKNTIDVSKEKLQKFRLIANEKLQKLAQEQITIDLGENESAKDFSDLSLSEQKRAVKKRISSFLNQRLREYLSQTTVYDYENSESDFLAWFFPRK